MGVSYRNGLAILDEVYLVAGRRLWLRLFIPLVTFVFLRTHIMLQQYMAVARELTLMLLRLFSLLLTQF